MDEKLLATSQLNPLNYFFTRIRTRQKADNIFYKVSLARPLSRALLFLSICLLVFLGCFLWPLSRRTQNTGLTTASLGQNIVHDYFSSFDGFSECNIRATDLIATPPKNRFGFHDSGTFCHDRKQLLKALSEGGRVGFDAPYNARGCRYRWFQVEEICFILERFDGLIFIGDDTLQTVYNGLNILLRRDLILGSLDATSMDKGLREDCRCNNQFIKQDCKSHYLADSAENKQNDRWGRPYFCNRVRHAFLRIKSAQPTSTTMEKFRQLVPQAPRSSYRPIPIVHSLGPATVAVSDAAVSLVNFVKAADDSGRTTPILWIGPTAAGHIELKGRKGNQEIWDFDQKMAITAQENDVDVLRMWNMTVQATSWDGMRFGEKVAITQAMMVMNWLSRLESS